MTKNAPKNKPSARKLLAWYDGHARSLPWRIGPKDRKNGILPDPYHVWLSEMMLQQTTVAAVIPYFLKFLRRWPTLTALAKADLDEVNQMWAGLGYYRRARFLLACAKSVVKDHGGIFPQKEPSLRALPGIGPYTAAAIAAIAFDQRANVIDGNVERVISRLFAIKTPLPAAKTEIKEKAAMLLPTQRFGDYAQALMDLGATVCLPRTPDCSKCPWNTACRAQALGLAETLPRRQVAKPKPTRYGFAFILLDPAGRVLLQKRPDKGLLAGMLGLPTTPWEEKPLAWPTAKRFAPASVPWQQQKTHITHAFTHFTLDLSIAIAHTNEPVEGKWVRWHDLDREALPSVMRKALALADRAHRSQD